MKNKKMDNYELIWFFQKAIIEIYDKEGLDCLRRMDEGYIINDKNILEWHSNVTARCSEMINSQFDYMKNIDDLLICSDELLYFTANLFLYRPYINNPVKEGFPAYGRMIYPNHQNLEAKRYNMFADIASEKAYNYWDRIGDLIASFFPDKIQKHKVFFSSAIDAVPDQFRDSDNYLWLNGFKKNGYLELNEKRKQIVHYTTSDSEFKYKHLKTIRDKSAMEELQAERESIADFYKNHISLTFEGFERTLKLLDEINHVLFR